MEPLFGKPILENFIIVSPSLNRWDGHYSQNLNIEKMWELGNVKI